MVTTIAKKRIVTGFLITIVIFILGYLYFAYFSPQKIAEKKAIEEITTKFNDQKWVESQKTFLNSKNNIEGKWYADNFILMENGEWIVCKNLCHKEDPRIKDFFIGRDSNGKWHYSSYHFCIKLFSLSIAKQPKNLDEFKQVFILKEIEQ